MKANARIWPEITRTVLRANEIQDQNQALNVLYVPYSLDSGTYQAPSFAAL